MKPRASAVKFYDKQGSLVYETELNRSIVYGASTDAFVRSIAFRGDERALLDIGCGTGFALEILREKIVSSGMTAYGVDPATGMLEIARAKFEGQPRFSFREGAFEKIPFGDAFFDKIISTLALHWAADTRACAREMARVLKDTGSLDLLMIAADDGARFRRAVFEAQKKHLTFAQVMRATAQLKRMGDEELREIFEAALPGHRVEVTRHRRVVHGTFDEHMSWWKARARSVAEEVKDFEAFLADLKTELAKISEPEGIPFDGSCLALRAVPR